MKILVVNLCLLMSVSAFAKTSACEKAYQNAKSSPSTGVVSSAIEICDKASEKICREMVESVGGAEVGDGRYVAAACALLQSYGSNKAVHNGKASAACEKAKTSGLNSGRTGDASSAIEVCDAGTKKACDQMTAEAGGYETGDGRYVSAFCALQVSHGAFVEASKK